MNYKLPLLFSLFLVGCVSYGTKIDPGAVSQLKVGQTEQQVQALIGKPNSTSGESNGNTIWSYDYIHEQLKPVAFVPIANIISAPTTLNRQTTTISFGPDGRVKSFSTRDSNY
jgi:outer membrane protein assembly factor BamE (lipoprotein component of BamABCDE complex)